MRSEAEIRAYIKQLEEAYAKTARPPGAGRPQLHLTAMASVLKGKIDMLRWVVGEEG